MKIASTALSEAEEHLAEHRLEQALQAAAEARRTGGSSDAIH